MELPTLVAWIGTIIGCILNLTPITMFRKIYLEEESIEIVPESMLIFNILCPSLWACYWWLQVDKFVPFFSAMLGVGLSEIFALIYLFYFAEKNIKLYLLYAFLEINLLLEFNYIFLKLIGDYSIVGSNSTLGYGSSTSFSLNASGNAALWTITSGTGGFLTSTLNHIRKEMCSRAASFPL